jgi:hypothetical protein
MSILRAAGRACPQLRPESRRSYYRTRDGSDAGRRLRCGAASADPASAHWTTVDPKPLDYVAGSYPAKVQEGRVRQVSRCHRYVADDPHRMCDGRGVRGENSLEHREE